MHERGALLLGIYIVLLRRGDAVRGAVVVDNLRVINRDVRSPAVEIIYGITSFAHHLGYQTIRGAYRTCRIVHEARLHLLPADSEIRQGRGGQRDDVELVMLAFARREFAHRTFLATGLVYHPLVLGAVVLFEPLRL